MRQDFLPPPPWEGPPIPQYLLSHKSGPLQYIKKPTIFYHITSATHWPRIQIEGLKPQPLSDRAQELTGLRQGVYVTQDLDLIDIYAKSAAQVDLLEYPEKWSTILPVLKVRIPPGSILVEDPESLEFGFQGWILDQWIPPQDIQVLKYIEVTQEEI